MHKTSLSAPVVPRPSRSYINPKATGKQIILVSRIMIMVYGILSGVLAIVLFKIGLSLGWVYLVRRPSTLAHAAAAWCMGVPLHPHLQ